MLWLLWEKSCFQELQEEKRMQEMQETTPYPCAHRWLYTRERKQHGRRASREPCKSEQCLY